MNGEVWSRVIDGVAVTVDVEATRAAYEQCEFGVGCDCGDCQFIEPLLPELIVLGLAEFMRSIGVNPLKPNEFVCCREGDQWFMAELWYECVGAIEHADVETSGIDFEGSTTTLGAVRCSRTVFKQSPAAMLTVQFDVEWLAGIVLRSR